MFYARIKYHPLIICIIIITTTLQLLRLPDISLEFEQTLHNPDLPPTLGNVTVSKKHVSERTKKTEKREEMLFIDNNALRLNDLFAATWLQNVENFLLMDVNKIKTVEDGNLVAIRESGHIRENARMTVDWLDFCVEHLSKWWKTVNVPNSKIPTESVISFLRNYIWNGMTMLDEEDGRPSTALEDTVAIIAFQPYNSKNFPSLGQELTTLSLAATIASLYQAGFGRVIVVGLRPDDATFSHDAFQYLRESFASITGTNWMGDAATSNNTMIGAMQVGHIHVTDSSWFTSTHIKYNVPRAAIVGLQLAMNGDMDSQNRTKWLGLNSQRWKYVYLTEPDTILNTRRENLARIRESAEKGLVLVPHRLQPIPHASDIKDEPFHTVPNRKEFSALELNSSQGHSCCDDGKTYPWTEMGRCGFWWQCGFNQPADSDPLEEHKRILKYGLMRLASGTGVVSLAGTNHGRRCVPRMSGNCNTTAPMK